MVDKSSSLQVCHWCSMHYCIKINWSKCAWLFLGYLVAGLACTSAMTHNPRRSVSTSFFSRLLRNRIIVIDSERQQQQGKKHNKHWHFCCSNIDSDNGDSVPKFGKLWQRMNIAVVVFVLVKPRKRKHCRKRACWWPFASPWRRLEDRRKRALKDIARWSSGFRLRSQLSTQFCFSSRNLKSNTFLFSPYRCYFCCCLPLLISSLSMILL